MEAKTFDEVYTRLLDEWTANPEQPLDEFLKKKLAEAGVSKEKIAESEETCKTIEKINENAKEIESAKGKGFTLMQWLRSKVKKLAKSKTDDEEEQDVITDVYTKSIDAFVVKDEAVQEIMRKANNE